MLFMCEGIFCYLPQARPQNSEPHTHAVHVRGHLLLPRRRRALKALCPASCLPCYSVSQLMASAFAAGVSVPGHVGFASLCTSAPSMHGQAFLPLQYLKRLARHGRTAVLALKWHSANVRPLCFLLSIGGGAIGAEAVSRNWLCLDQD